MSGKGVSIRTKPTHRRGRGQSSAFLPVLCVVTARAHGRRAGDQPGKPPVSLGGRDPQPQGAHWSRPGRPAPAPVTTRGVWKGPGHSPLQLKTNRRGEASQPLSEKCPLPCFPPHAWDSRHQRTRVPHGCSPFSGGSEPQSGEGLQKEESCLAQRMQYFPEDSPGSAGGALAEHV